jgi:hypothetical protein
MEVTTIEVNHPNPQVDSNRWIETAGMFKEDPLFDDMLAEVKAYRQTLDG